MFKSAGRYFCQSNSQYYPQIVQIDRQNCSQWVWDRYSQPGVQWKTKPDRQIDLQTHCQTTRRTGRQRQTDPQPDGLKYRVPQPSIMYHRPKASRRHFSAQSINQTCKRSGVIASWCTVWHTIKKQLNRRSLVFFPFERQPVRTECNCYMY